MSTIQTLFEATQDAVVGSLGDVFSTMLGDSGARRVPAEEINDAPRVSTVVGFGGTVSGFVAVHLSAEMACAVASAMLQMELSEVDDVVRDAIGEIGNMVTGGFKKWFSDSGHGQLLISLPTVVEGQQYSTKGPAHSLQETMGVAGDKLRVKVQLVVEESH